MTDMTAFERQLSSEISGLMGPVRPVDDLAVFESVTTASRSPRWGFTMFSALKFVAAGVIVALFGGFLLAGVVTTPQDSEVPPAAVTESPSPMTTEELLSGMVTEEVEPGVFRVVNDGVRDLDHPDPGYPSATVDVTPDGSVWLSGGGEREGAHGLFRLGEDATFEDPARWPPYLEVAPDGSLWAIAWDSDDRDVILSFDGEGWTARTTTTDGKTELGSLAVGPDGTVWATDHVGMVLLRLEDDGTLTTSEYWADVYSGLVSPDEIAVSPDGDVWLVGMVRGDGPDAEVLLRFDGSEWEVIEGPESFLNHPVGNSLDIGPDGTLWVNASDGGSGRFGVGGLARFDDPGWTSFTEADGVQNWGGQGFLATDLLAVAPDGSLWMNGTDEGDCCGGVAHYDGATWDSYLVGSTIHDLAIAPDGSAWVRTSRYGMDGNPVGGVDTYVITPEAERDALVAANAVSGVLATVEGFSEAVNAYDTEAIRTFVTDDYTWQSTGPITALDEYLGYVDAYYEQVGFHAVSGEPVVRADGEVYVVEVPDVVTVNDSELIGITVHRVVADGDGWLIQESRWTEDTPETTD